MVISDNDKMYLLKKYVVAGEISDDKKNELLQNEVNVFFLIALENHEFGIAEKMLKNGFDINSNDYLAYFFDNGCDAEAILFLIEHNFSGYKKKFGIRIVFSCFYVNRNIQRAYDAIRKFLNFSDKLIVFYIDSVSKEEFLDIAVRFKDIEAFELDCLDINYSMWDFIFEKLSFEEFEYFVSHCNIKKYLNRESSYFHYNGCGFELFHGLDCLLFNEFSEEYEQKYKTLLKALDYPQNYRSLQFKMLDAILVLDLDTFHSLCKELYEKKINYSFGQRSFYYYAFLQGKDFFYDFCILMKSFNKNELVWFIENESRIGEINLKKMFFEDFSFQELKNLLKHNDDSWKDSYRYFSDNFAVSRLVHEYISENNYQIYMDEVIELLQGEYIETNSKFVDYLYYESCLSSKKRKKVRKMLLNEKKNNLKLQQIILLDLKSIVEDECSKKYIEKISGMSLNEKVLLSEYEKREYYSFVNRNTGIVREILNEGDFETIKRLDELINLSFFFDFGFWWYYKKLLIFFGCVKNFEDYLLYQYKKTKNENFLNYYKKKQADMDTSKVLLEVKALKLNG